VSALSEVWTGKGVVSCKSSFLLTLPINLTVLCRGSKKLTGAYRDFL